MVRYRRWLGKTLCVDTERLSKAITSDGRSMRSFSFDCGLSENAVSAIVRNGVAKEAVLDTIACELGMHMSELVA